MKEQLIELTAALATLDVMLYGGLLVAGIPFGKTPDWANRFAWWQINAAWKVVQWLFWLPLRILFGTLEWGFKKAFGSGKKKKKKRN